MAKTKRPKPLPVNHGYVALNAVGITDAFMGCMETDERGAARMEEIKDHFGNGWLGVAIQLADAARWMDECRCWHTALCQSSDVFIYDIWDAIATGLWDRLDKMNGETMYDLVSQIYAAVLQKHIRPAQRDLSDVFKIPAELLKFGPMPDEDALLGICEIAGQSFHVQALRVRMNGESCLEPTKDPYNRFDDMHGLDDSGCFTTVEIPGHEGQWLIVIHPFST